MTLLQDGSDVVATGSGTINTADLGLVLMGGSSAGLIFPMDAIIYTGPSEIIDAYAGAIAGPTSFGSGPGGFANADSEDLVGISDLHQELIVPSDYLSRSPLMGTSTYDDETFSSLGVTPCTYVWTWGSGANTGSFTLRIGPEAVPEPATVLLFGAAMSLRSNDPSGAS